MYREEPDSPSLAVTINGVTIEPDTVIADERFVYMAFRISGYSVADRTEPGFDMVNVYQGDHPEDESAWVNMSGTMYDGIVLDENGASVYEDGTSVESYEDGNGNRRDTNIFHRETRSFHFFPYLNIPG